MNTKTKPMSARTVRDELKKYANREPSELLLPYTQRVQSSRSNYGVFNRVSGKPVEGLFITLDEALFQVAEDEGYSFCIPLRGKEDKEEAYLSYCSTWVYPVDYGKWDQYDKYCDLLCEKGMSLEQLPQLIVDETVGVLPCKKYAELTTLWESNYRSVVKRYDRVRPVLTDDGGIDATGMHPAAIMRLAWQVAHLANRLASGVPLNEDDYRMTQQREIAADIQEWAQEFLLSEMIGQQKWQEVQEQARAFARKYRAGELYDTVTADSGDNIYFVDRHFEKMPPEEMVSFIHQFAE